MKLKSIAKQEMKMVNFHGIALEVPEWVGYIAANPIGELHGYPFEPELFISRTYPEVNCWDCSGLDAEYLGTVELEDTDWKDTLVKV